MLFERGAVDSRAEELVKRGAIGVFNLVRLPGNELSRDFSDCGNPCFNIGGRDGLFLESILDRAAQAGVADKIRARIDLQTQTYRGLKAINGVAIIRGASNDVIVLNAHVDGWFDGAGDNGDGLAVLIALARHFAKPANRPQRTIAFVASAGHHTPGINGPRSFVAANPDLAKNAVMLVNIEHVAQRNFSPARTTSADGYREAVADSGEAPIAVGVTNNSPYPAGAHRRGAGAFRRQLHLGAIDVPERRDRRMGGTERREGLRHAGAAAVSHDRRSARRDLGARTRAHRPVPGVVCRRRSIALRASGSTRQSSIVTMPGMKRIIALGTIVLAGALTVAVAAQQPRRRLQPSVDNLTVEKVKDNLWVIRGGGGNTAVFATANGLTLVDTKQPGWGQPLLDKIKTVSDKPITTIINTHTHYDHVSGNVLVPASVEIIAQENTAKRMPVFSTVTGRGETENVFKANPGKGLAEAHVQGQVDDRIRRRSDQPVLLRPRAHWRRRVRRIRRATRDACW